MLCKYSEIYKQNFCLKENLLLVDWEGSPEHIFPQKIELNKLNINKNITIEVCKQSGISQKILSLEIPGERMQ